MSDLSLKSTVLFGVNFMVHASLSDIVLLYMVELVLNRQKLAYPPTSLPTSARNSQSNILFQVDR